MAATEILFIIAILAILYFLFGRKDPLGHIPGPKGLPYFGNAFQLNMTKPHLTFQAWSKKYGPVFKIKLFGQQIIVTNDFDSIYEVLVTRGKDFAGRGLNSFRSSFISRQNSDIFFQHATPSWNVLRKAAHKHIKMYASGMPRIEQIGMSIISEMVQTFRGLEGKEFNPRRLINNTVMNITAFFAFGKKYDTDSEEFKLFDEAEKLIMRNLAFAGRGIELDILPFLRFFGNSSFKNLARGEKLRDKLLTSVSPYNPSNLESRQADEFKGVMYALYKLDKEQTEEVKHSEAGIHRDNVEMATADVLFAGTETTVSSYYSFLHLVAQYPHVLQKLQEEVDSVIGTDRPVTLADREHMPYTRATVLEVGRFATVVPMGVPHSTMKDTSLLGKPVPAGTNVFTNLFSLHHDEDFWGDPYTFRPERFLDADGEVLLPSCEERRHLMPFGAGPRVCVGEILAQTRLFLLITTTSQVFNVKLGHEIKSCDPRDYILGAISYTPEYKIILECRNEKLFKEE